MNTNWKKDLAKKANTTADNVVGVTATKNGIKVLTKKPIRTK